MPGAEIVGFDMDFTALITPRLTLRGGWGYADSEVTDPLIIPNPQNPAVPLVDSSGFVGQRLAQAPDFTGNLSVIYRIGLPRGSLTLRGDWSRVGSVLHELVEFGSPLADLVAEPSYDLVNLRLTYASNQDWELSLWGRNVTDERYRAFRRVNPIIRVFGLEPSGSGLAFPSSETAQSIPSFPEAWGLTFIKQFGAAGR